MKMLIHRLAVLFFAATLLTPALAVAQGNYDADARFAEGNPPVIPHAVADDADGPKCLSCHWPPGKAPTSPHPVRVGCTQCHVRSVLDAPAEKAAPVKEKRR